METKPKNGFTLIEILIVVAILGILAAIVIPAFADSTDNSAKTAFVTDLKRFAEVADYHYQLTGEYFEGADSGVMPAGLATYILDSMFTHGTPIGGVWDFEKDTYGVKSAVGVHFNGVTPKDDATMTDIDTACDDGDLSTGAFRKFADDRFYLIIAH